MSFFDEDDPQPTRREPAARPARPRSGGGGPTRTAAPDHQTLLIRRIVAAAAAVLLLVLAFVALRGCLAARHESQLEDYNTRLGTIISASDKSVGTPFFARLSEGGAESPQDLQAAVNGYRATAEQQLDQAEDLDVPDEMRGAHTSALMALEYRANGLEGIQQRIRAALGDQSEQTDQAIGGIAGQMQSFLASDVTWQARVVPLINDALAKEDIRGPAANTQRFLTDLSWLQEETVAERLGRSLTDGGDGGGEADEEPAPGLHRTGLVAVGAGEATLQQGAANRIPAAADTLTVRFANQGENDESDVRVVVKVDPIEGGGETITLQKTVDTVAAGAEASVSMPLNRRPPAGSATTISVEVRPVPGEEKTDNNKQEYEAIFEG